MNQNAAIWFISIQSVVDSWRLINNSRSPHCDRSSKLRDNSNEIGLKLNIHGISFTLA